MVKKLKGIRENKGKPRVSLIMSSALLEVAKVGTQGAEKYDDHNWRHGMKWSFMMDAIQRHYIQFNNGNRKDHESKISHLAHVAWNALALLEYEINGLGEDDLWKGYKDDNKRISKRLRKRTRQYKKRRKYL